MQYTKAVVTAQAFNRITGIASGVARPEEINLRTNKLFVTCATLLQIKEAYESFWNKLNPHSEDVVFVQRIDLSK